jgi:hypothetical protein
MFITSRKHAIYEDVIIQSMAILHISSEEHGLRVRTAMPESTQAHRQKQVNLTWHTHG